MSRLYWGGGIALLVWLLPPTISTGGSLNAGPRHVDGSIYGATAGDRHLLAQVDAVVVSDLQPIVPAARRTTDRPRRAP